MDDGDVFEVGAVVGDGDFVVAVRFWGGGRRLGGGFLYGFVSGDQRVEDD